MSHSYRTHSVLYITLSILPIPSTTISTCQNNLESAFSLHLLFRPFARLFFPTFTLFLIFHPFVFALSSQSLFSSSDSKEGNFSFQKFLILVIVVCTDCSLSFRLSESFQSKNREREKESKKEIGEKKESSDKEWRNGKMCEGKEIEIERKEHSSSLHLLNIWSCFSFLPIYFTEWKEIIGEWLPFSLSGQLASSWSTSNFFFSFFSVMNLKFIPSPPFSYAIDEVLSSPPHSHSLSLEFHFTNRIFEQ